ncbi:MFS transporter [Corynebacterium frankenforstense]|uniref:MFS transporter n=1 Tax=Corynebacterium frankenforstense TaxID=1230998 RepID=UPI00254D3DFB|nr:MFS transporter [Corynebacterium frankenforstense]MDK6259113.1 MFS transporter [Corynebacterium frankenforstense]
MAVQALSRAEIEKLDSIWKSPGYIPTLLAVACAFGSWSVLLPVVPLAVIDSGGSETLAGWTTGAFILTTVATQVFTPRLLRRFGYTPVMAVAAFLLGVPALGYMLGMSAGPALGFSALRGFGFGALTVAESALIAELVPVRFLGKASGMLGVFLGVSQMLCLPLGLALVNAGLGYNSSYIVGAVIAVGAALLCLRIPAVRPGGGEENSEPSAYEHIDESGPKVPTWKLVTVPAAAIMTVSMSFGAVSTFLPAAVKELDPVTGAVIGGFMLSIVGGASMVFRYASGVIADRRGMPGSTMRPGQALAVIGVALMAVVMFADWSVWWLVVAAVCFGGGFGVVQNEALLTMFMRLPRSRVSDASAIWNGAYDSGTGVGSVIFGMVAAGAAYSNAFAMGAAVIALGLLLTFADAVLGRHRIAEHSNTRARLRQVPVARRAVRGARALRRRAADAPVDVAALLRRRPPRPGWKGREENEGDAVDGDARN